jgi:hypothetical protein
MTMTTESRTSGLGKGKECSDCRFFASHHLESVGSCRRYPPKIGTRSDDDEIGFGVFPTVWDEWWCGEWRSQHAKSEAPEWLKGPIARALAEVKAKHPTATSVQWEDIQRHLGGHLVKASEAPAHNASSGATEFI